MIEKRALQLAVRLRRSFFQVEEDRKLYVTELIDGTARIIEGRIGLANDDCFHELCRLLGKINASNQLLDFSLTSGLQQWLDLVFQLTITSLENWKRLPNSQHYLVGRCFTFLRFFLSASAAAAAFCTG